jgi:hypothetical protein
MRALELKAAMELACKQEQQKKDHRMKSNKFAVKGLGDVAEMHAFNSAVVGKHSVLEETPIMHYRMLQEAARGTMESTNSIDVADMPAKTFQSMAQIQASISTSLPEVGPNRHNISIASAINTTISRNQAAAHETLTKAKLQAQKYFDNQFINN